MKNRIFASIVSACAGLTLITMIAAPNIDRHQAPTLAVTTTKGDEAVIEDINMSFGYLNEKKYGENFSRSVSFYQGKSNFSTYNVMVGIAPNDPRHDMPLWSRPTEAYYEVLPNGNTIYYEVDKDFDQKIVTIRYSLYDGKKAIKKNQKIKYVLDTTEYCNVDITGQFNQDELGLVLFEEYFNSDNDNQIKKLMISTTTGEASKLETVELPKDVVRKSFALTYQPMNEQAIPLRVYGNRHHDERVDGVSYYLYDVFSNQFEALGQHEYINDLYGEKLYNANNIFANGTHYELLEVLPKGVTLEEAGLEDKENSPVVEDDNQVAADVEDEEVDPYTIYPHQFIIAKWDKQEQIYQTVFEYTVTKNTEWYQLYQTNYIMVKENLPQGVHQLIYDIESESVIYEGTVELAHPSEGEELVSDRRPMGY